MARINKAKIKIEPELFLFKTLQFLVQLLPIKYALYFFSILSKYICKFLKRDRAIADAQIQMTKRLNGFSTSEDILDDVSSNLGQSIAESIILQKIIPNKAAKTHRMSVKPPKIEGFSVFGYEHTMKTMNERKGGLFLSGHIGPIELLAAYVVQAGVELYVIGRLPNNPKAQKILKKIRKDYGTNVIWRGEKDSPKKLLKAIKKGCIIAALIDQDTSLESEFTESLGLKAAFPSAPIQMALRYSLPIFASFIVRTRKRNYSIMSHHIEYDKDSPKAVQEILQEYSSFLDNLIYTYPEQWVWWHRRWRRRPGIDYRKNPEALISTSDYINWIKSIG